MAGVCVCSRGREGGSASGGVRTSLCPRLVTAQTARLSSATLRERAGLCALCAEPQSWQEAVSEVSSPERREAAGRPGPTAHSAPPPASAVPSWAPRAPQLSWRCLSQPWPECRPPPLPLSCEVSLVLFPKTSRAGGHSPHCLGRRPEDRGLVRSLRLARL